MWAHFMRPNQQTTYSFFWINSTKTESLKDCGDPASRDA
jgi:hypothetical protein